jgi:hypothetical protein
VARAAVAAIVLPLGVAVAAAVASVAAVAVGALPQHAQKADDGDVGGGGGGCGVRLPPRSTVLGCAEEEEGGRHNVGARPAGLAPLFLFFFKKKEK